MKLFEIKHRFSGSVLFSLKTETLKLTLEAAVKAKAYLGGAYLGGVNLRGANLTGAYLGDADLRGADLGGVNLRGAYLGDADLRGVNLGGADLRDADLGGVNLRGAYLGDADLGGVNLRGAYLGDADLGGAYLGDADLGGVNLRGAYLGDADLRGAINYVDNHDFFAALIYKQPIETFTEAEWAMIGQVTVYRYCWAAIQEHYGQPFLRILEILEAAGFEEYAVKYREILGVKPKKKEAPDA